MRSGLWTRSVPRIWRCAPEGATFLFWAPRALANRRRVGPARAAGTTGPIPAASHMVLCRRLLRRCGRLLEESRRSFPGGQPAAIAELLAI